jgi:hypothetical protein
MALAMCALQKIAKKGKALIMVYTTLQSLHYLSALCVKKESITFL